jgi:hypothetical protein
VYKALQRSRTCTTHHLRGRWKSDVRHVVGCIGNQYFGEIMKGRNDDCCRTMLTLLQNMHVYFVLRASEDPRVLERPIEL